MLITIVNKCFAKLIIAKCCVYQLLASMKEQSIWQKRTLVLIINYCTRTVLYM
jgi:hypothetical protein